MFLRFVFFTLFSFSLVFSDQDPTSLTKAKEKLKKELCQAIFHIDPTAKIGLKVVNLKTKETIFETHSNDKFIPADTIKLFTAGAALDILGPNYCFETRLLTTGAVEEGVLNGALYLQGSGDPSLKTSSLEDLMFQLKLMNIKKISGDLIFDSTEFDELSLAPGWMNDKNLKYRDAPVDALTINHSRIDIWVRASKKNQSPYIQTYPEIPGIVIENEAIVSCDDSKPSSLMVTKKSSGSHDIISITGKMSAKEPTRLFKLPVKNPHLYVATEFCELLKKNQISFKGGVRFDSVPESCDTIATHLSDPVFKLVIYMLKQSDHLYANCLLKKIGRCCFGKPGTWPSGSHGVRDFLTRVDQDLFADMVLVDGSGESRFNKVTPDQVVRYIQWAYDKFAYAPEIVAALPVAGIDGLFKKRLLAKQFSSKLRAIPGSLESVSSLSGVLTTLKGQNLAFSILINDFMKRKSEIKAEIEDKVCCILSNYSEELD